MINFAKTKKGLISILLVIILIFLSFVIFRSNGNDREVLKVQKKDLKKEVSIIGEVAPIQKVNLSFERAGTISSINFKSGDKIERGNLIATLENNSLKADLQKAKANLDSAQAKLKKLKSGTRKKKIKLQKIKVANHRKSVKDAKQKLVNTLSEAYTDADDVLRNTIDQFFENPRSGSPSFALRSLYPQLENQLEFKRRKLRMTIKNWKQNINKISTESNLDAYVQRAQNKLKKIKLFLNDLSFIVNNLKPYSQLSQSQINTYKSDVKSARTSINKSISDISNDEANLNDSLSKLRSAKKNLKLKLAGTRQEKIKIQEAKVEQAKAKVSAIKSKISETYLYAPISGVISKKRINLGETVSASENVLSIISKNELEIEANIPEFDISEINKGDEAIVKLDAFPNKNFKAKVKSLKPGKKVVDGVVAYETILKFKKDYEKIRPGMTADIKIIADQKRNVLSIPKSAIKEKNNKKIISLVLKRKKNPKTKEVKVKTGFESSSGWIEIKKGLKKGNLILANYK
ncbi:MAG: efflux RND transporter periplasmic adaptor subunit [Candidatus Magasanikbacteria bacterium]